MPRALFVACDPPGHATYRYRCEHLATVLRDAGWGADVVYVGQSGVLVSHHVVVLHRICDVPEGRAFARAARACGAALVYSTDDLVFDANAFPNTSAFAGIRNFAPRHKQMLTSADAVLCSTQYLAQRAQEAVPSGSPVHTVRNFLDGNLLRLSETAYQGRRTSSQQTVTLGYLSGSATHDRDLARIAEPLARVLRACPQARLLIVGPVRIPAKLEALGAQLERLPFRNWKELPALLAARVDINLAPLDTTDAFVHAKSEIKLLEAAAVGIPTVATPAAGLYETASEGAQLLFPSDPESWERILRHLIEDAAARRAAGEAARTHALQQGVADIHRAHILQTFTEIASLPRTAPAATGGVRVNWPIAPKYVIKAVLARLRRRAA